MQRPQELTEKMKACQGHKKVFLHDLGGWWCEKCNVIVATNSSEIELMVMESRIDVCQHRTATRKGKWGFYYYCDACGIAVAMINPELLEEEVLASNDEHRIAAWQEWQERQQLLTLSGR